MGMVGVPVTIAVRIVQTGRGLRNLTVKNTVCIDISNYTASFLVWRIHSLGVHLSYNQNVHRLQHLKQQHEQQIHKVKRTTVSTTVPQVVDKTLKCSNLLVCSLLTKS